MAPPFDPFEKQVDALLADANPFLPKSFYVQSPVIFENSSFKRMPHGQVDSAA